MPTFSRITVDGVQHSEYITPTHLSKERTEAYQ